MNNYRTMTKTIEPNNNTSKEKVEHSAPDFFFNMTRDKQKRTRRNKGIAKLDTYNNNSRNKQK
jgi:hypothetical protein